MDSFVKIHQMRTILFDNYEMGMSELKNSLHTLNQDLSGNSVFSRRIAEFFDNHYLEFTLEELKDHIQDNAFELNFRLSDEETDVFINYFYNVIFNFTQEFGSKYFFEGCLFGNILAKHITSDLDNKTIKLIDSDYPTIGEVSFQLSSGIEIQLWTRTGCLQGLDRIRRDGKNYFFDGVNSSFYIMDLLDNQHEKDFIKLIED